MTTPAVVLQFLVLVADLAAKWGPGLIEVGENLIHAIETNGDLTDAEKADLISRVNGTRAQVAAYEPHPPPK